MKKPVRLEDANFNDSFVLCPLCGDNYMHHETVTVYSRSEDSLLTSVTAVSATDSRTALVHSDECGNPSTRRDGLDIEFWCEQCGEDERFRLCIEQHKGHTFMSWRKLPPKMKPVSPRVHEIRRPLTVGEVFEE